MSIVGEKYLCTSEGSATKLPNFPLFTDESENIVSVLIIGESLALWSRLGQLALSVPHPQ